MARRLSRGLVAAALLVVVGACSDDDEGGERSLEAFCTEVELLDADDPFAAFESSTDTADAERALEEGLDALRPLAEAAPSEIADDAEAYVDGFERFADLLRKSDFRQADVDTDELAEVAADLAGAQTQVEAFADERCSRP